MKRLNLQLFAAPTWMRHLQKLPTDTGGGKPSTSTNAEQSVASKQSNVGGATSIGLHSNTVKTPAPATQKMQKQESAEKSNLLLGTTVKTPAPATIVEGPQTPIVQDETLVMGPNDSTPETMEMNVEGNAEKPTYGGPTAEVPTYTAPAPATPFAQSETVRKAFEYTNTLLGKLNSKTSYTDQIAQLIKDYQNREAFSYDASDDVLFQQMLASSMASGRTAMADTMGQAAALTGGYGSTYSQAVGNSAYNQYVQEAYDNLPQYYQMAFDAYNQEGQNMLNELAMLSDADAREYERRYNEYAANFDHAQALYNREYAAYQDSLAQNNFENEFNYGVFSDNRNQANYENEVGYEQYQDELNQYNTEWEQNYKEDTTEWEQEFAVSESEREQGNIKNDFDREDEYFLALNDLNGDGVVDAKDREYSTEEPEEVVNFTLSNSEISQLENAYRNAGGGEAGENAMLDILEAAGKMPTTATHMRMIDNLIAGFSDNRTIFFGGKEYTYRQAMDYVDTMFENGQISEADRDYYVKLFNEEFK